jgi:hypothetical protein
MDYTILELIERRRNNGGRRVTDRTNVLPLVMGGAVLLLVGFLIGLSLPY